MQNALWRVQILPISSSLKNAIILWATNNLEHESPEDIVDGIIEIGHCFKKQHHHMQVTLCGLLPHDECTSINCFYVIETNKILKVKCSLNKFFFIDQDTYWTQPNGCLSSDMFYLGKLHLVEKGNIVLAKSICRSMEYSHRIITKNEFKTLYKLATAFQLSSADFLYYRLNMCVKLFIVVLKSCQVNLSVMLLLNLFVNLFLFLNSLVYLYLLKASIALLIVL